VVSDMGQVRCSICEKFFDSDQSRALPFCSPRCKMIDLGRWLDEKHGLPYEREEGAGDDGPQNMDPGPASDE
jgi:uncharacterized protein